MKKQKTRLKKASSIQSHGMNINVAVMQRNEDFPVNLGSIDQRMEQRTTVRYGNRRWKTQYKAFRTWIHFSPEFYRSSVKYDTISRCFYVMIFYLVSVSITISRIQSHIAKSARLFVRFFLCLVEIKASLSHHAYLAYFHRGARFHDHSLPSCSEFCPEILSESSAH